MKYQITFAGCQVLSLPAETVITATNGMKPNPIYWTLLNAGI